MNRKNTHDGISMQVNMAQQHADVYILGDIGWDATVVDLIAQIEAHGQLKTIDVHINTFGGAVGEGLAMLNTLRRHVAEITTIVEGYALSMGSVIALAGDHRKMPGNTLMMIHRAQGGAFGDAADMSKQAQILEKHETVLINEYMRVMSASKDDIQTMLNAETWFTAEEALEAGLITEIIDPVDLDEAENTINPNQWQAIATAGFNHAPADFQQRVQHRLNIANSGGQHMPEPKNKGTGGADPKPTPTPEPTSPAQTVDAAAVKRQAIANENSRQTAIRAAFTMAEKNFPDHAKLLETCLADPNCTIDHARAKILDEMGKNAPGPIGGTTEIVADEKDKFSAGVTNALAGRAGLLKKEDTQNNFRSYTLLELARASLRMNGVSAGNMSKIQLVGNAFTHTSGDFSSLLANVAEKAMLKGYDEADETFQIWTFEGEASDFKPVSRADLNSFPDLDIVSEGGEYQYGTIGDRGETVQLATYGKLFGITRQAIINDDLGAFTRIPQRMGRAAIRTVGNLVYAVLTGNPTMSDGTALFHANHNNLLAAAGINTDSIDLMRVKMGLHKDAGANAHALNIRMANLIVPLALQGTANVVRESEFEVGSSAKNNTIPNSVRGTFDVIADARLDGNSSTAWYGAASASQHDTIEVTYLDGQTQPYLDSKEGWSTDGAEFKVRIDAAVSPLDFRTLAKNPGV